MDTGHSIVPSERVESAILLLRGQKVILDADLARLYGATTKRLNEQVKRNQERFPEDFLFQLTTEEKSEVVANCDYLSTLKFSPVLLYDEKIETIIEAIRRLMDPPETPKKRIGFEVKEPRARYGKR
jgi:hypothetical protein